MKRHAIPLAALLFTANLLTAQNVGIGTLTPGSPLEVKGTTAPGNYIINTNNTGTGSGIYSKIDNAISATLSLQSAIRGEAITNIGVAGLSTSGTGVAGFSQSGLGVYGTSVNGNAVRGYATGTGAGGYFFSTSGPGLLVGQGNVGIGVLDPSQPLEVKGAMTINAVGLNGPFLRMRAPATGDSACMIFANGSYFAMESEGLGTNPYTGFWINRTNNDIEPFDDNLTDLGTAAFRFKNVYAGNGTIQTSDGRMKKNISGLNYGLDAVMKLRPVAYDWKNQKDGRERQIGFIAQEVELVVPEAVVHSQVSPQQLQQAKEAGKPIPEITDPYGMKYNELIPVLTKAIQEQQQKIEALEKEILLLKNKQ